MKYTFKKVGEYKYEVHLDGKKVNISENLIRDFDDGKVTKKPK